MVFLMNIIQLLLWRLALFRQVLDGEMKVATSDGVCKTAKMVERTPITQEDEQFYGRRVCWVTMQLSR